MKERTVAGSDGTPLYVSQIGSGPTLVLCDGIGCDQYVWKYLIDYFRDDYHIVCWNYRGHGRSGPPRDPEAIHISDHAGDLLAVLDALRIQQSVWIGHSMGVQVILEAYGLHPERARALVPMCGSYQHPLDTFRDSRLFKDGIFPVLYRALTAKDSRVTDIWKRWFPTEFAFRVACVAEINPRLVKREDFFPYLEHMANMDPELFIRMLACAGEHTAEAVLPKIAVPTLIFAGSEDRFTPPWLSDRMGQLIPTSELCRVPGGTHTAPIEVPDLVNFRLEKFLRQHGLTT